MPKKGWKCLNLNEEEYSAIEKIARRRKMSRKAVVLEALEAKYPFDFQNSECQII